MISLQSIVAFISMQQTERQSQYYFKFMEASFITRLTDVHSSRKQSCEQLKCKSLS